jgi:hypothetical protein
MMILPIPRAWIVSPNARRLYTLAALFSIAFEAFVVAMITVGRGAAHSLSTSPFFIALLRGVVFVGALAAALTWVSMLYFWFEFDNSHFMKKFGWFLALILAAPTSAFYCLTTYRNSKVFLSDQGAPPRSRPSDA